MFYQKCTYFPLKLDIVTIYHIKMSWCTILIYLFLYLVQIVSILKMTKTTILTFKWITYTQKLLKNNARLLLRQEQIGLLSILQKNWVEGPILQT